MADDDKPQGDLDEKVGQAFQKFLEKFQKPEDGALKLYGENYELRQKNTMLKAENDDLKKKVPAVDSIVISKDDNTLLEAARALKLKPEELTNLSTENSTLKKDAVLRSVADAGYSFSTLRDFDALEGSGIEEYAVKEEAKDGKTQKSVVVKVGGKELPLDDYAKEKRPALASILKSDTKSGQGTAYIHQDAGGKAPAANKFDEIRAKAKERQEEQAKNTPSVHERFGKAKSA